MAAVEKSSKWWGTFELAEGQVGRWRIGPLDLWIERTALDWRMGWKQSDDLLLDTLDVRVPDPDWTEGAEDAPEETARFGFDGTQGQVELGLALADRPVVARPAVPFFVPPGERVELFLSTPVWIRAQVKRNVLTEVACARPSDTWFGTNTRGQLAYATRTRMRRQLDKMPIVPHRAISCVRLENGLETVLPIERLSLPVPQLSIYASESGTLWTETVKVKSGEEGGLTEVTLGKVPPQVVGKTTLVSKPRESHGRSFASLVLGGLFEAGY